LGPLTNAASEGIGRNEYEDEFEYEYDRRTKTILEVRGRENLVLVEVRFSSPVLVLVSAIGCKSGDLGVPKSNELALMRFQPWAWPTNRRKADIWKASLTVRMDTGWKLLEAYSTIRRRHVRVRVHSAAVGLIKKGTAG
jgi:hypothetical protein